MENNNTTYKILWDLELYVRGNFIELLINIYVKKKKITNQCEGSSCQNILK